MGIGGSAGGDSGNNTGWGRPGSRVSEFNNNDFLVEQKLRQQSTATLVRVKKFKDPPYRSGQMQGGGGQQAGHPGTVQAIGHLDIEPLVDMQDGAGNTQQNGVVYNVPYLRMHSTKNKAIIMDPEEGDICLHISCDRDTSKVKVNQDMSPPGSFRHHNIADGVCLGAVLTNQKPTCYDRFTHENEIHRTPDDTKTITKHIPQNDQQDGSIAHSVTKGTYSSHVGQGTMTASVDNGNMDRTTQQGDITHTAQQGNLSRSAPQGMITDSAPKAIRHIGPTNVSGTLGVSNIVSALGFGSISDARIKTNIQPMVDVFDLAMQLQVDTFDHHEFELSNTGELIVSAKSRPTLGLIAQQVKPIFPELVSSNDETPTHQGVLSVEETKVGMITLAAFQEYVAKTDARIAQLEALLGIIP